MHKLENALLKIAEEVDEKENAAALSYLASIAHHYAPPAQEDLDIPDGHELIRRS